ncbi:hypothetical protein GCM10027275_24780 [Rhabdobacter roseus]|uniref:Uncharacterized protein n=1 Tax=Rhabdobacter roseus TaxID=1655419 RepID=A0A840TW67_9BACT|nr:hypothetical protein [Rhabdobacter roseus]MBB5284418.1 hypothetical protein [Rhabdobacter roseus]
MLEIRNEANLLLDLDPDTAVEIEYNNWLLGSGEELPGTFSYPVSFPLSDNNKRFLGYSYLPETRPRDVKVAVALNGMPLSRCTLSYRVQRDGASGYLKIDSGELASRVKGRYLHEAFTERFWLCNNATDIRARMKAIAQAAPGTFPVTFFPVYSPLFAPKQSEAPDVQFYYYSQYLNAWNGQDFVTDFTTGSVFGVYPRGFHVVPYLYLTYVIERVCALFGYRAVGTFLQHPEVRTWTVDNTQTIDSAIRTPPPGGVRINLGLHVPYLPITDFLKALRDDLGVGIYFDSGTLEARFELLDTIQRAPAQDLSPFVLKGYDNEIPDEKGYSVLSYQDNLDEIYKDTNPVTTKIKQAQKEVKCSIGTLAMQRVPNSEGNNVNWYVPSARMKGNLNSGIYRGLSDYFSTGYKHKNEFGLRLLSYRGFHRAADNQQYPLGTSISRNYFQEKIGDWSLDPEQNDSVYRKLTLPYYFFQANARQIRYELLLPLRQLRALRMYEPQLIRGENSVLTRYLVQRLNVSLPGWRGQIPVKASLLVLLPPDAVPNRPSTEEFYVELLLENYEYINSAAADITYADVVIRVWADAGKTLPANPSNLPVTYEETSGILSPWGGSTSMATITAQVSGHEYRRPRVAIRYEDHTEDANGDVITTLDYLLLPGAGYVAL